MTQPPVLLVIFDGFGLNLSRAYNGWAQVSQQGCNTMPESLNEKDAIPCQNR